MQKKIIEILNYNNLNSEFCSKHFPELFNRPDKMSYDLIMIFKAWQRQNLITEKYKSGEIINLSHGDPVQSQLSKNFKKTLKKYYQLILYINIHLLQAMNKQKWFYLTILIIDISKIN